MFDKNLLHITQPERIKLVFKNTCPSDPQNTTSLTILIQMPAYSMKLRGPWVHLTYLSARCVNLEHDRISSSFLYPFLLISQNLNCSYIHPLQAVRGFRRSLPHPSYSTYEVDIVDRCHPILQETGGSWRLLILPEITSNRTEIQTSLTLHPTLLPVYYNTFKELSL